MRYWVKLSHDEQDKIITEALRENIDYRQKISLGIPASRLDPEVFYDQAPFLKEAPLLRAYVQNANHIGCHTMGSSEIFFKGTQHLEREVVELLSVDVLKAKEGTCDGYIASGGTEANIQAAWIYRNYFMKDYDARLNEIALIGSDDTHYSIAKAANILQIGHFSVPVDNKTREINPDTLDKTISMAKSHGVKFFIVIANMGTTMFGSVDNPDVYSAILRRHEVFYKIHVDGAFGGFIYPISDPDNNINFSNPEISSITLDAHKMLQAPYGTGIFLARKGLMEFVYTKEAQYVNGMDLTLSGSRSGTNAIAVWMILFTYGPFGWLEKINKLLYRTDWCCSELDSLGIAYYRHPKMNIITINADHLPETVVEEYGLVPDNHNGAAEWYKIVIMDHVDLDQLEQFIHRLRQVVTKENVPVQMYAGSR